MIDQIPFGPSGDDFAGNPEQRTPCVLVLDISGSMSGDPIKQLNAGIDIYKEELMADSLASRRVEVAIVSFGGKVETVVEFTTAERFVPPVLSASGDTPMGAAIATAIDMIRDRKDVYKTNGIPYTRPWIFLVTDGGPTDKWQSAAESVKMGEKDGAFLFFSVGVDGANFDILKQISTREPLQLKGLEFRRLFQWLSASQQMLSRSSPGDINPMPPATGDNGWATIPS